MDYADAREAFFQPRAESAPGPGWSSVARTLRDAIEPVATVCFWSEPAYDAYAALGLDFLQGYVYSRGSVLGAAEPAVVAAAFAVVEPGLIADVFAGSQEVCSVADVRAAKERGAVAALRAAVGEPSDPGGLAATAETLGRLAAAGSPAGRPLYAGLSALDRSTDPWAAVWHAATMLREFRGDSHLAAVTAHDLDGVEANLLTELWVGWEPLAYTASRAWSPEAMDAATARLTERGLLADGALTDAGVELRGRLEVLTDAAVDRLIAASGVPGSEVAALADRLAAWGDALLARGWFPPDPLKRAAG